VWYNAFRSVLGFLTLTFGRRPLWLRMYTDLPAEYTVRDMLGILWFQTMCIAVFVLLIMLL
jgi:hypothetical protein